MSGKSRLLSEEEIRRAYSARCDRSIMGGYKNIAKAQLAKCERIWYNWGKESCPHSEAQLLKRECPICWEEFNAKAG